MWYKENEQMLLECTPVDLLYTGLPQNFHLFKKKKAVSEKNNKPKHNPARHSCIWESFILKTVETLSTIFQNKITLSIDIPATVILLFRLRWREEEKLGSGLICNIPKPKKLTKTIYKVSLSSDLFDLLNHPFINFKKNA